MSISSISSNSWKQQLQQDCQSLSGALQSGSLSGAQSAFSALMQLLPNSSSPVNSQTQTTATPSVSSSSNGTSSINNDLSALGQAIQSGNLTGAQNDFTQLTQDMQKIGGGHHHHHHKISASSENITTASATGSTTSTNSIANDLAALSQALQSGNLSTAGSVFSQLTQDLQTINSTANSNTNFQQLLNMWTQNISAGNSINIST
jgi:hypothetical protein